MPIDIAYTDDGGVLLVGRGVVTGGQIKEANNKIYETPQGIANMWYQIADFSEVTKLFATSTEVEELAMQDKKASEINPNMVIALVGKDDLIFGLSRMWEALTADAPFETMVFRKLEDARQWIKVKLHSNA